VENNKNYKIALSELVVNVTELANIANARARTGDIIDGPGNVDRLYCPNVNGANLRLLGEYCNRSHLVAFVLNFAVESL
jgi:hypothetical protein